MLIVGTCTRALGSEADALSTRLGTYVDSSRDRILIRAGTGLCSVYNQILKAAVADPACEAVVLLHDDTYILDHNFRAKIVSAFRFDSSLGVIGVVGASGIASLAWWEGQCKVGQVHETRGFIDFGSQRGLVDVVDGLLMVISRRVFVRICFDEQAFPGFHGYDVDYCLQVRKAGFGCMVLPIEVLHRTKGGFGNQEEFNSANQALLTKWRPRA